MDQTQLNKFKNPKDKVTQEKLLEANVLDKWAKPAMTRRVLWKTTNGEHRTMIKKDYGIKREVVEELTAFPLGTYCFLERTDVANLTQKTLYKRSDCSWDNFDDYKESTKTICFVEHVVDHETGKRFLECSCIDALKGSAGCIHKLAMEMALGDRPTPNLTPITHFAKKSGRPKKNS